MEKRWVPALLASAFMARLAFGLYAPAKAPDGSMINIDHYAELAGSFADRWTLSDARGRPSADREPGYPIFLGMIFKLFGKSYLAFLIVQSFLSAAALGLLFWLGRDLSGPAVGLGALAVGAFYPPFIYYAALPARETWMTFLNLLSLWLLMRAIRRAKALDFALAGVCGAAAALSATTVLPFGLFAAPGVAVWLLGRPWKNSAGKAAVYAAAFGLAYATWPLRNHAVFHRWILGSTAASGDHFYMFMVVPEEIGGTAGHYEILAKDHVWQQGKDLPPADREAFFWKAGLKKVRRSPPAYLRLVARRFLWDAWRFAPRPRDYGHSYRLIWWLGILTDGWIIPLGFLGMILSKLRSPQALLGCAFVLSVSFTYSLVLAMIRYRLVLMPWMILFAVFALDRLWRLCRAA